VVRPPRGEDHGIGELRLGEIGSGTRGGDRGHPHQGKKKQPWRQKKGAPTGTLVQLVGGGALKWNEPTGSLRGKVTGGTSGGSLDKKAHTEIKRPEKFKVQSTKKGRKKCLVQWGP